MQKCCANTYKLTIESILDLIKERQIDEVLRLVDILSYTVNLLEGFEQDEQ